MKPVLFLSLILVGWSPVSRAIVGPEEAGVAVPAWLSRIYVSRNGEGSASLFCYGSLIDSRWVVSSAGCLNDPYQVLKSYGPATERQYSVRLGQSRESYRVKNRYQSPDAGLMLYELDQPVAVEPVAVSMKGAQALEGEHVVVLGLESSEPLGHDYYNPDGSRSGSCSVNGREFFDTGILCYVFTWPVRHSVLVKTEARLIDPQGPDRPDTPLDRAVRPRTDGSRLYMRYADPASYACIEDMGMPIVHVTEGDRVELVGLVNAVGMAAGLPVCSSSIAHWYTSVSHYRDFLVRARADARFRSACPARPVLNVDYPARDRVELAWQPVAGATGYRLFYAPVSGRREILSVELGNVNQISRTLSVGDSYEVAVQAYSQECTSPLSLPVFVQLPEDGV
jgi:hypothetical protein